MSRTCRSCQYFAAIERHPAGAGHCCVNPPTAVPMMAGPQANLVRSQPVQAQPLTLGLDPPVVPDRIACRFYAPEHLDA